MECFFTAYLFLHGVIDTCSFLDVPFFTAKVFLGDIALQTKNSMRSASAIDPVTLQKIKY